jgi:hypothetical protein
MCAVQKPVHVLPAEDIGIPPGQPGAVICAMLCLELTDDSIECVGFNYVINGLFGECQFYNNPPTYCNASVLGCAYYEVCSYTKYLLQITSDEVEVQL